MNRHALVKGDYGALFKEWIADLIVKMITNDEKTDERILIFLLYNSNTKS